MKKNEVEFYLGDKIKTKKSFKPLLPDKTRFDNDGKRFEGIIVDKRASVLLIDFGQEYPFTTHLAGALASRTGYGVDGKDVEKVDNVEYANEGEKNYANLLKELMFNDIKKIPREIRALEDSIASLSSHIRSIYNDIKSSETTITGKEYALNAAKEKQANTSYDTSVYVKQYRRMLKNKKIKELKVVEFPNGKGVLVTTNDLKYKNPRSGFEFELGAYKIYLPLEGNKNPLAINYKRHVQKFLYHHPCVKQTGMCLGSNVEGEVRSLLHNGDIISATHLLILFLEEPNYGRPYIDEVSFSCAQDVTIAPENDSDWFNRSYWESEEKWDGNKYTEDLNAIQETRRVDLIRN